jgi:polysaccharide pyruvyl transferase CsaB
MILLVGYYGFGNTGDEAILTAILAQFREDRPDLRIVVASGNPARTAEIHHVESIPYNDIVAIHRAVQACRLVIIGGGGLFHDYWGVDPDTFLTSRHWGAAYYAGPALLARLYGKPVMLYAVGIGPLCSEHGARFTRLAAEAAQVITVRDEASRAELLRMEIPAERIRVTADPTFGYEPLTASGLEEAVPSGFVLRRPILGVAPRYWNLGVHPEFLERELAAALDLFVQDSGGSVLLTPFQDISGEKENDQATASRILQHMRFPGRAVVARGPASVDQMYGRLKECDAIVGMRLHSIVFAAAAGRPCVSLSYDPKVDGLVARLGLQAFALDARAIDARVLHAKIQEVLRQPRAFADAMALAHGELRSLARENFAAATVLLEAPAPAMPITPEVSGLLARSLLSLGQSAGAAAAISNEAYDGLAESTAEQTAAEQDRRVLTQKLAAEHKRLRALEESKAALQLSLADLRTRLENETNALRKSEESRDGHAAALAAAERQRVEAVELWDRYRTHFYRTLEVYRNQRAWQMMLLFRKAYTLLTRRSKASFLRWAAGVPFRNFGSLAEYDLDFPDPAAWVPDALRQSLGTPAPAASGPAQPESQLAAEPENPPQRDLPDLVVLAIIDFDFRFQRPQQLAAEFARRGHRVFWISPTRFLPPGSERLYEVHPLRRNLWEIHLRSRQPDIYMGELKPDDVTSLSAAVSRLFRDWNVAGHAVLVQLPFWRQLALKLRAQFRSIVCYDCMDDWETFENMGKFNVSEERRLVHETDVLIVTGAELVKKFAAQGLDPLLARNGADFPFFSKAGPNNLLAAVPHPVVGYFGAIADWIDLDLVYEVARLRPQYSFVLIGQVFGRDTSKLEALPNVRLLGNKPYADIPGYLYNFDACLIPFLLNQVTKATDPVKLYEYFSLGKPVVATDMKELEQCAGLLYIGRGAEDFACKVDQAVAETDRSLPRRRIDFAKANTWSSRVDDIEQAVLKTFPLVSVIVVSYNSAAYVRPCLDSLLAESGYPSLEVIVVDNASQDDTTRMVGEYAARDSRVRLHALEQNLGFAGGNNFGVSQSRGEYLVFLNVDTMVTACWIDRLLRHLHQDPSIGLLCPVTNFAGNEVKVNIQYGNAAAMKRFAQSLAVSKFGERMSIRVAPLYCAMMPRAVWDAVGEMDELYQVGMFEDDDLSFRIRQAGYGVSTAEDCFIHHFGQGSFSKLPGETYNRIFEENRKRFEEKWKQPWTPHRTRPGVRPAFDEKRFDPAEFTA